MAVTVAALVADAAARLERSGSTSPRLDAELLLGFALNVDRVGVLAHPDAPVPQSAADAFEGYVARREQGEPVAYVRGFREFHGLAIATDARALVPRPETEQLVDEAVAEVARRLDCRAPPARSAAAAGRRRGHRLGCHRGRADHCAPQAADGCPRGGDRGRHLARRAAARQGERGGPRGRRPDGLPGSRPARGRRGAVRPDLRQPAVRGDRRDRRPWSRAPRSSRAGRSMADPTAWT